MRKKGPAKFGYPMVAERMLASGEFWTARKVAETYGCSTPRASQIILYLMESGKFHYEVEYGEKNVRSIRLLHSAKQKQLSPERKLMRLALFGEPL